MTKKLPFPIVFAFILCTTVVHAKTASEIFEKVSLSVVIINTYDAFGRGLSLGSGVVLEDGIVVTNCHVIKDSTKIQVVRKGIKYPATLRHTDWDRDVCTLAVVGLKGHAATKGSTNRLKIGEKIYVIGAPKGLELTLSDGLISGLRPVTGGQYLQITAPISPGSSGGGLFDSEGRLIGLPTFYVTEGQQLNFAVPVEWINELPKHHMPSIKPGMKNFSEWHIKAIELDRKKDLAGGVEHALRWTKAQPDEFTAWFCLGNAYGNIGQTAQEIEAYQQAIRLNPENFGTWLNIGNAYEKIELLDKAIEAYQQAIRLNPELTPITWSMLANVYFKTGQTTKALEAHKQAIQISPNDVNVWYNLGVFYFKIGQPNMVMEVYNHIKTLNKDKADQFYNNVVLYEYRK